MNLPSSIQRLIDSFERLPGVGPKTAQRLAFYLLPVPQTHLDEFAESLSELKRMTTTCSICFNVAEADPCRVCASAQRDKGVICVVEQALDVLALERSGQHRGVYHVLHGAISPLDNIGPDEIKIDEFLKRLKDKQAVREIILATDPDMEGEATAMYISKKIRELKEKTPGLKGIKVTRLGQGLPIGADLEYADEMTLSRALEGRRDY